MTDDDETQVPQDDPDAIAEPEIEPVDEDLAEPGEEPATEPEQPAEPVDAAPTARQLKAIERAHTTHETKLREIMGEAFELFRVCPTCEGAAIVPAELAVGDELAELPGAVVCEDCKGYGQMRTPSRVPGQELQVCVSCAGLGWKREQVAAPPPEYLASLPATPPANGQGGAPPGYILVKIDPNAPELPAGAPVFPAPAPAQV